MIARVIHFGADECHRMLVLRSAGYSVQDCRSLLEFRECLATHVTADAIVMSDGEGISPCEAAAVAKAISSLPIMLFRNTNKAYEESGFDLVVQCLTPPEVWLNEVDALIKRRRLELRRVG